MFKWAWISEEKSWNCVNCPFLSCNSTISMSTSKMFASSAGSSGSSGTSRSCCSVSGNCSSWLASPRGKSLVTCHAIPSETGAPETGALLTLSLNCMSMKAWPYLRYLWIYRGISEYFKIASRALLSGGDRIEISPGLFYPWYHRWFIRWCRLVSSSTKRASTLSTRAKYLHAFGNGKDMRTSYPHKYHLQTTV